MEIVERIAINTLGGSLTLRTTPNQGSVFTLRIPLSISIIDAFALACGEQPFVVPVSMVDEIIEIDPARVIHPPSPAGKASFQMIERRGQGMPLVSLLSLFAMPEGVERSRKALIVSQGDQPFAFAVDRMLGQQEVVVRPLEDPLVKVTGVAGATDLGDGKPTLVLDLLGLVGVASRLMRRGEA
jgi:two-component system, chemotaxis family, sensor kinase CheA